MIFIFYLKPIGQAQKDCTFCDFCRHTCHTQNTCKSLAHTPLVQVSLYKYFNFSLVEYKTSPCFCFCQRLFTHLCFWHACSSYYLSCTKEDQNLSFSVSGAYKLPICSQYRVAQKECNTYDQ